MTKTGAKVGTLFYMSPEQVKARKDIDQRSDIYSLGITFYEMLSGRLPFNDSTDSDFEIMNEIVNVKLSDPRDAYPYISDKTVVMTFKMAEKDRDLRYSNCKDIINSIENKRETVVVPTASSYSTPTDIRKIFCHNCGAAVTGICAPIEAIMIFYRQMAKESLLKTNI